jgi:sialidase-1
LAIVALHGLGNWVAAQETQERGATRTGKPTLTREWEDARIKRTIVRREGDDGSKSYRIPALTVTPKGTVVACFDIRWDGSGDLPANIDVGVMRSTDLGDTWGPLIVALDYDGQAADSRGNGVGDPAILVDQTTGHLYIAALWSFGNNGWHGSGAGFEPTETGQLVISRSTDDGLTWEPPRSITKQIKAEGWRLLFNGPGAGIQLTDGTLVFAAQFKDDQGKPSSCFIYSRDQGANWQISPPAIPDKPWTSEAQVVQVSDGSLLMTMRNESRDPQRAWSKWKWQEDLATGRWVETRLAVNDPVCMASLLRHPSGLLLLSNNDSNRRERMTVRSSRDDGKTWSGGRLLDPRPSAYSCLAVLPNGEVGILYECGERNSTETLTFARFPLAWVTGD